MSNATTNNKSFSFRSVEDAWGRAPLNVTECPSLTCNRVPNRWSSHHRYNWAINLSCLRCNPEVHWIVCRFCPKQLVIMDTQKKLQRHHLTYHSKDAGTDETRKRKPSESEMGKQETVLFDFDSKANNLYFKYKHRGYSSGLAYLAAVSCFHNEEVADDINDVDANLEFHLARLCFNISRGARENLATVLYLVVRKFTNIETHTWNTSIPQTVPDIRSRFLKGVNSYIPMLPHPTIEVVGDYAYVPLASCIMDLLAHGFRIDPIVPSHVAGQVKRVSESKKCLEILSRSRGETDLIIYMTEWSDSFEPNNSTKGNRGSVHVKTVTFSPPHNSRNVVGYTYPIVIGPSKGNRENIEKRFKEDLESLKEMSGKKFYHGGMKKMVSVHVELIVSIQDQPERRGVNQLMLGMSRYTPRWGYSLDFKQVADLLPSCDRCHQQLLSGTEMNEQCQKCTSWQVDSHSEQLCFTPPAHFPVGTRFAESNGKIKPHKLSYALLKEIVTLTHNNVASTSWNIQIAKAFLSVFGINTVAVAEILEHAGNAVCLKYVRDEKLEDQYSEIMDLYEAEPAKFEQWPIPVVWERGLELDQHIDAIMHLLFLGLVKTLMKDTQDWLTKKNSFASFLKVTKNIFESVQSLGLSWCRAIPYGTGRFGGHVSENYVACARLSKWFFHIIENIKGDEEYIEPDDAIPQSKWLKETNVRWLKVRGLPSDGDFLDVRDRVKTFMNSVDGAPKVLPPSPNSIDDVIATYSALLALLGRVMTLTVTEQVIVDVDRHIRLFLDSYEKMDKDIRGGDDTPSWISHYNFLSLLNIPDLMKEYGPLRNLWEGGTAGEAIIGYIKPEITMGYRLNWAFNLLLKVLRNRAFQNIAAYMSESDGEHPKEKGKNDLFCLYNTESEARHSFDERKPLSCTVSQSGSICLHISTTHHLVIENLGHKSEVFGLSYFTWAIKHPAKTALASPSHYAIMLPLLEKTGLPIHSSPPIFALITSEWKEMLADGNIDLPQVIGANYDSSNI